MADEKKKQASQKKPKLPGPETREAFSKQFAPQFEFAHEAFALTAKANQQALEALAPGLKEKLGIDVAALTSAYREAFEQIAKKAEKQWR